MTAAAEKLSLAAETINDAKLKGGKGSKLKGGKGSKGKGKTKDDETVAVSAAGDPYRMHQTRIRDTQEGVSVVKN